MPRPRPCRGSRPEGRKLPTLDAEVRGTLPGSFVRLSLGFVHYELLGPVRGRVLVLVPGLSVPYTTWDRNAGYLALQGFRVLRYEHYGRGYSDRPRGAYDLDFHVEQLAELLQALLPGERVFLAGLSMGGPVAAAFAGRHPDSVAGIALVDPLFEWPARGFLTGLLRLPLMGETVMALFGARMLTLGQRGDFFQEKAYRDFVPLYTAPLRYRGLPRSVLAAMRSLPSWQLVEGFRALGLAGLPTLLVWGREDAVLPLEQSGRLLRLLPGAEFLCIEGAGHVPHWEKPEVVNAALLGFLGRLTRG